MGSRARVEPVMGGVREVLHAPGVAALLGQQAAKAAARCNAMMDPQMRKAGGLYESEVVSRGFTAGGRVYVSGAESGKFARIDNYRHNTLRKGCGT